MPRLAVLSAATGAVLGPYTLGEAAGQVSAFSVARGLMPHEIEW